MYVFSGYGIAFDGADSWSFGNDNDINSTFGFSEKKVSINFDKAIIL